MKPEIPSKRIIRTSASRTEMFGGIAQPVVVATWSDGSQTLETVSSLIFAAGQITIRNPEPHHDGVQSPATL